jgi:hypothetical protein
VAEAGLAKEGEEPADALLGAGAGEDAPDVRGERAGSAEGGEGVGAAVDAVPDEDAGLAGCGGEGLDGGAGLGGDVLGAALAVVVLLAQPVGVGAAVRGRGRLAEPGAGEELPDGALAAPGDAGDLARAVSLAGEVAELVGAGRFRFGRVRCEVPGGKAGNGMAGCCQPDVVGAGGEPGGDGADGQAGADERVQVVGSDGVGAGPGQETPLAQSNDGSQLTGSLMPTLDSSARAWRCRQKSSCSGMVRMKLLYCWLRPEGSRSCPGR